MRSKRIQFVRDSRGQSLIEFALILPMMLVVMFMITEFGRALYMYNVISQAARAAARAAVVSGSGSAVANGTDEAHKMLQYARMDTDATVDIAIDNNFNGSGIKVVTATVSRPFTWAFKGPLATNAGSGSATVSKSALTLTGKSIMKAETF